MVYIKKGGEPNSLTEFRESTPYVSYDGLPTDVKDDIRNYLLIEQGYICAYCMERVDLDSTTIAHFIPQSTYRSRNLEYGNMLGVCSGNEGSPYNMQTCGCHRRNKALTINPHVRTYTDTISYSPNGLIVSTVSEINVDMHKTLNLNVSFLAQNRKTALDALKKELHNRRATGTWKPLAEKYIAKLSDDGKKRPYYGILLWYLHSKVR